MPQFIWDDEPVAPDLIEPITACRAWKLVPRLSTFVSPRLPLLSSTGVDWIYRTGAEDYTAGCMEGTLAKECRYYTPTTGLRWGPIPNPHHSCGFWGLNNWVDLRRMFSGRADIVYGTVQLWGRVIPGDRGWRAQYLRIASLSHPLMAQRYGVPMTRKDRDTEHLTPRWERREEAS